MPDVVTPMREIPSCEKELFCAIPFYSIWHQVLFENYWLPGPAPVVRQAVTVSLREKEQLTEHEHRLHLVLKGSFQSSLIIGPKAGASLKRWSLLSEIPAPIEFNGQRGHFVLLTAGVESGPMNITLDVRVSSSLLIDFRRMAFPNLFLFS
uniref:Endoplasmic reticulum metallopeptidase 1-like C-terminal domain-containing protein n=1 Tax=Anopheles maculatus TaxID=74869 RepID=A0A182T8W2_9DIPT